MIKLCCLIRVTLSLFLWYVVLQPQSSYNIMPKKGKNKAKVTGEDSDIEILPRIETIYKDTKVVIGIEPEFKCRHIYQMFKEQTILDIGLEDISLYVNIRKFAITKLSTHPDISVRIYFLIRSRS